MTRRAAVEVFYNSEIEKGMDFGTRHVEKQGTYIEK
jgi:hypothetical protein